MRWSTGRESLLEIGCARETEREREDVSKDWMTAEEVVVDTIAKRKSASSSCAQFCSFPQRPPPRTTRRALEMQRVLELRDAPPSLQYASPIMV